MAINFKTTPVFTKLKNSTKKIIVMQGGSRSSKTFSAIQYCIIKALEKPDTLVLMAKKTLQDIKRTLFLDFKKIMIEHAKIWDARSLSKDGDYVYTFNNGSTITFTGLSDEGKVLGAKYNYIYVNECNQVDYESVFQLLIRHEDGKIIFDFNPNVSESFWIYTKILTQKDDAELQHSTFRDNPFLNDGTMNTILSLEPTEKNIAQNTADEAKWKIYGLGIRADITGQIYTRWEATEVFPSDCINLAYGLDFGFTNDPTALILKGEKNDELYVQELIYEPGLIDIINPHDLNIPSLEGRMKQLGVRRDLTIWADCAEPKAIANINAMGFNCKPAQKPAGSIIEGINIVQRYKIRPTKDSKNLINELENYTWKKNKSNDSINEPIDAFNHLLDPLRYILYMENPSFRKSNGMIFYDTIAANKIEKRHDIFYIPNENDIDDDDD